jgi:hypothetical protein
MKVLNMSDKKKKDVAVTNCDALNARTGLGKRHADPTGFIFREYQASCRLSAAEAGVRTQKSPEFSCSPPGLKIIEIKPFAVWRPSN